MSDLQVHTVASRREWNEFIELPYRLRAHDPAFVPPLRADLRRLLDREHHPFWREARGELFVARRGGQAVGRIAAIECPAHDRLHGGRTGFFGFLECADDLDVCAGLSHAVESWHRSGGVSVVRGPVSPSTNYECGFLVEGFGATPTLMMPCNPPFQPRLIEQLGYQKAMDLLAYVLKRDRLEQSKQEFAQIKAKLAGRTDASIRPLDMKHFDAELERLRFIYNDAWSENWGFVPMGADEFRVEADGLRRLAEPGFVMIAERAGEPIAFIAAFRDVTKALMSMRGKLFSPGLLRLLYLSRHSKHLRVAIAGVVRKQRRSGIMALLYLSVMETGWQKGIVEGELSWILETNTLMRRVVESMGAEVSRVFRIYEKALGAT
ncbi:MAG: N-acetyltransferase [Planctomycetota bacterium]